MSPDPSNAQPALDAALADELRLAAAHYAFGRLSTSDITELVDSLLNRGVFREPMAEIFYLSPARQFQLCPLFERLLRELGITLPNKEGAIWFLLRHHIANIAAARVTPYEGLRRIIFDVYYPAGLYVQDGATHYDIDLLYGTYYSYDDVKESHERHYGDGPPQPDFSALDCEVIAEATRWLQAHPAVPAGSSPPSSPP